MADGRALVLAAQPCKTGGRVAPRAQGGVCPCAVIRATTTATGGTTGSAASRGAGIGRRQADPFL